MAIELALKAFLFNCGRTERDLRRLGHDLRRLLDEAEKLGLDNTGSRHFRLSLLGANYDARKFAYPAPAVLNTILPRSLRQIAYGLIKDVFISIKGEKTFADLSAEPGLCIQSAYPEDLVASAWAVSPNKL
jgi:hypothetical protein